MDRPKHMMGRFGAMAAAATLALGAQVAASDDQPLTDTKTGAGTRNTHKGAWRTSTYVPGGGAKERENRRRQIANGQLKAENGLDVNS